MARIVTGLDIGVDSIKLVQVKRTRGDSFVVTANAIAEIRQNVDVDITSSTTSSPVGDAIKRLLAQSKIHPANIITSIPKQAVVVRYITLPTNTVAEVQQMIRFEAAKYVPFFTDEDIVDFELLGSSPLGGSEVLLVVSRRSAVEEHLALLRSHHMEPFSAEVNSLALVRTLKQSHNLISKEINKTHLVLDLGAGGMELSLVQNQALRYTRTALMGSIQLAKLLQDELNIPAQDARAMIPKLDLSRSDFGIDKYPAEKIQDALETWLDRLDNELKRSIDYVSSEFGITQIHHIVLSGGLSKLSQLKEHLEKEIGIPVSTSDLSDMAIPGANMGTWGPQFNSAFGLALRKLDAEPGACVNLLPPEILKKRVRRKQQRYALQIAVGILILACGGVVYGYQKYTDMQSQINKLVKEIKEKEPRTQKLEEYKRQIDSIKKMVNQADPAIDTLAAISLMDTVPTRVTIERFNYVRNETLTLYAVSMNMNDAVNFRHGVEETGFFKLVEIQNANTDMMEGKPVVRFQIVCKINQVKDSESSTDSSSEVKEN